MQVLTTAWSGITQSLVLSGRMHDFPSINLCVFIAHAVLTLNLYSKELKCILMNQGLLISGVCCVLYSKVCSKLRCPALMILHPETIAIAVICYCLSCWILENDVCRHKHRHPDRMRWMNNYGSWKVDCIILLHEFSGMGVCNVAFKWLTI